ncbi:MAG: hypothetical protein H7X97_07285 [Opitutaceae bacterium]|nr:hypothetical protein [Verrucomicrobiales bacterium]
MQTKPEPASEPSTESDEQQLCTSCLCPNEPLANFCIQCGAPISSYAATGPFEHLFAEGHMYRQAVERPHRLIVVLGIWLMFGMMALGGIGIIAMGRTSTIGYSIVGAFLLAISLMMIWKTTRNYLTRKQVVERIEVS